LVEGCGYSEGAPRVLDIKTMFDHRALFRKDKKAAQVVLASRVRLIGAFQFDFEPRFARCARCRL